MNTLTEYNKDKDAIIKLINKHRLSNKNKWYQVSVSCNGYNYEMKCFDTWIQTCYVYKDNKMLYNESSSMDLSVSKFKEYLKGVIK